MELYINTMPFIILTVYFIVWFLKRLVLKTDRQRSCLPPIAMIMGCTISLLLYFFMPETTDFNHIIDAATSGMGSGLAAVGCNQIYKQFQRFKNQISDDQFVEDTVSEVKESVKEDKKSESNEEEVVESSPAEMNEEDFIDHEEE